MPFPKQGDVEIPLLKVLADAGGSAKPRDIYPQVAAHFPNLTVEEQELRLESSPGVRKWWNIVQWVRQQLVEQGEIDGSTRGVWKLTDTGRARLTAAGAGPPRTQDPGARASLTAVSLRDLANQSRNEAKSRLLTELKNLTPAGFERFCLELLQQLGFRNMAVTRHSADGGIDGYGDFRQGAVSIKSAFQAKRWNGAPVRRPEIDKLRGAIQGDYDHGVFITTSRFTKDATEASYKKGAITILLLDGEAIAELMLERSIGVVKQPVYLYEIAADFFDFDTPDKESRADSGF
jgi:restriction system protein